MKGVSADTLNAMIWAVNVEPILAPMIIGIVCMSVISPAETKPTSRTVVMVEEFNKAVIAAPANTPFNRLEVIRASSTGSLSPAMAFRPSVSSPNIATRFRSPAAAMLHSTVHHRGLDRTSTLGSQLGANGLQLLLFLRSHFRVCEVEFIHRAHDGCGDHEPREPLVVGRHDEPGRVLRGRGPHSLFVSNHV